ncbi:hypothetical protein DFH29DRAFT_876278 [Suillus ampliporus]|nr:hypothetical protein DFH29DRAFT_876278 [Suillus ampliporus]
MTATISKSSSLFDVATQTDAHSFTITHLLVDAAVSTEDPGDSEVPASLQVNDGWKTLNDIPCIMGGITALVASVGGVLHGRTQTDFPWKTLPKELARLGCCLMNYPDETLMPVRYLVLTMLMKGDTPNMMTLMSSGHLMEEVTVTVGTPKAGLVTRIPDGWTIMDNGCNAPPLDYVHHDVIICYNGLPVPTLVLSLVYPTYVAIYLIVLL